MRPLPPQTTSRGPSPIGFAALAAASRGQSASGLDRLARRLEPSATWADLILPADVTALLNDLSVRVRCRQQVMHEWDLGRGWRGRGIAALFSGPSGTGKTTAAEVIAGDLGYDIHVVDLSSVVDKYIGETEKKLEVIFTEAERTNTVLLFDEADAIFGKRSEVKDARDRYANIEVSYLLQRIERFSGLAILTTNLGANLDEAFTRRLDVVVDFPRPDATARQQLWRHEFRPAVPIDEVDFAFCARAFDLTGGNIRNIVITAAYLAADAGHPVGMSDVIAAVQREYRKMGRLCRESEFGTYATPDDLTVTFGAARVRMICRRSDDSEPSAPARLRAAPRCRAPAPVCTSVCSPRQRIWLAADLFRRSIPSPAGREEFLVRPCESNRCSIYWTHDHPS